MPDIRIFPGIPLSLSNMMNTEGVATMENSPTEKETPETHRTGGPDDTRGVPETPESDKEKKPQKEDPPLWR